MEEVPDVQVSPRGGGDARVQETGETQAIEPVSEGFSSCYGTEVFSPLETSVNTQESSAPLQTPLEENDEDGSVSDRTTTKTLPSTRRENSNTQLDRSISASSGIVSSSSSFSSAATSSLDSSMSSSHSSSSVGIYHSVLPLSSTTELTDQGSSSSHVITEEEPSSSHSSLPLLGSPSKTDSKNDKTSTILESSSSPRRLSSQHVPNRQSSLESSSSSHSQSETQPPYLDSSLSSSVPPGIQVSPKSSSSPIYPDTRQSKGIPKSSSSILSPSASSPPHSYLEGRSPSSLSVEADQAIGELLARYCQSSSSSPGSHLSPSPVPTLLPGGGLSSSLNSQSFTPPAHTSSHSSSFSSHRQQRMPVSHSTRTPSQCTAGDVARSSTALLLKARPDGGGMVLPSPEYFDIYTPVSYLPGDPGDHTQSSVSLRSGFLGLTPGTSSLRNSTTSSLSSKSVLSGSLHSKRSSYRSFIPSPIPGTSAAGFLSSSAGGRHGGGQSGVDTPQQHQQLSQGVFFPSSPYVCTGSERQSIASAISSSSKTSDVAAVFLSRLKAGGGGDLIPPLKGDLGGVGEGSSTRNSKHLLQVSGEEEGENSKGGESSSLSTSGRGIIIQSSPTSSSSLKKEEQRGAMKGEDGSEATSLGNDTRQMFYSVESVDQITDGQKRSLATAKDSRDSPPKQVVEGKRRSTSTPRVHGEPEHRRRSSVSHSSQIQSFSLREGGRTPVSDQTRLEEDSQQRTLTMKGRQSSSSHSRVNDLLRDVNCEDLRIRSLSTDDPSSKRGSTEGENHTRLPSICCPPLASSTTSNPRGVSVHPAGLLSDLSQSSSSISSTTTSFPNRLPPTTTTTPSHPVGEFMHSTTSLMERERSSSSSSLRSFLNTILVEEELAQGRTRRSSSPPSQGQQSAAPIPFGSLARISEWIEEDEEEEKTRNVSSARRNPHDEREGQRSEKSIAEKPSSSTMEGHPHGGQTAFSSFIAGMSHLPSSLLASPPHSRRLGDLHEELRHIEGKSIGEGEGSLKSDEGKIPRQNDHSDHCKNREMIGRDRSPFILSGHPNQGTSHSLQSGAPTPLVCTSYLQEKRRHECLRRKDGEEEEEEREEEEESWKDTLVISEESYSFVGSRVRRHLKTPPSDTGPIILEEQQEEHQTSSSSIMATSPSPQQYPHVEYVTRPAPLGHFSSPIESYPSHIGRNLEARTDLQLLPEEENSKRSPHEDTSSLSVSCSSSSGAISSSSILRQQLSSGLRSSPSSSSLCIHGQDKGLSEGGHSHSMAGCQSMGRPYLSSSSIVQPGDTSMKRENEGEDRPPRHLSYDNERSINEIAGPYGGMHARTRNDRNEYTCATSSSRIVMIHQQAQPSVSIPTSSAPQYQLSSSYYLPSEVASSFSSSSCGKENEVPLTQGESTETKKNAQVILSSSSLLPPAISPSLSSSSSSSSQINSMEHSSDRRPPGEGAEATGSSREGAPSVVSRNSGVPPPNRSSHPSGMVVVSSSVPGVHTPGVKTHEVWGSCADSNGALYISEEEISQLWKELKYSDDILDYISAVFHRIGEVRTLLLSITGSSSSGNGSIFHSSGSIPTALSRKEEVIDGRGLDDFWLAYASLQTTPYPYGLLKISSSSSLLPSTDGMMKAGANTSGFGSSSPTSGINTELHVEYGRLARVFIGVPGCGEREEEEGGEGGGGIDLVTFTRLVALMDGETPHSLQTVAGLLRLRLVFLYFSDLHEFSSGRGDALRTQAKKSEELGEGGYTSQAEIGKEEDEEGGGENKTSSSSIGEGGRGGGSKIIVWNEWNWEGFKHSLRHTPAVTQGGVAACPETLMDALAAIGKKGKRRTANFEDFQAMVANLVVRGTSRLFRINFLRLVEAEDGRILRVPLHPLDKLPYPPPIIRHRIICCNVPTCPCQEGGVCTTALPGEERDITGEMRHHSTSLMNSSSSSCMQQASYHTGEHVGYSSPSSAVGGDTVSMKGVDPRGLRMQANPQGGDRYSGLTTRTAMEGGVEVAAEVSVISPPQALSGVYTLQPRSHFFSSSSSRNASPPSLPHASQDPSGLLASDPQQLQETDQQGETTARRRLLQQYPSRNEPASSSSPPAIIYALNFLLPTANGGDPSTSQVTHEGGTSTDRQKQQPCLSHPSLLPSASSSSSSSFLYPSGPLKPPHHHMGESVYYDTGRSYPSAQSMGSSSYQRADASSSGALPSIRPSLYQEKSSYAPSLGGRVSSSSSLPLPYPAGSTASPSRGRMPTSGGMGCPSLYPSPPQQPFPSRPRGASSVSSSSSIPPYSSISCLPSQPLPCSSLPRGGSSARLVRTSQPTNYEVSQSSSSSHLSPSLSSLRHHPAGAPGGLLQPNLTTAAGVGNETHEGSGADDSRRYSSSSSTATSTFPQQTCEVPVSSSSCSPSMDRVVSVPPRHLLSSASSLSLLPTGRLHEPASSSSSHQRMGDVHTESISGREEVPLPPYTTYDPSHSSTASASSSSPSSSSYPLPLPPGGQVVAEVSYEAKHRRLFENLPLGTSDLSGLPLLYVRRYPTASHAASSPSQPPLQAEGGDGDMGEGQRILQGRGTTSEEEMQRQMEEKIQGLNRNEEGRRRFEQEQLIEEENTRRRTRSYSLISRPVSSCGNVLQGENLVHFPLSNQTGSSHLLHHPLLPSSGHPGGKTGLLPPGGVYTPGNGMGGGLQNSSFSPPLHQSAVYSPPFEKDGRQISSSSSFSVSLEQRQREDEGLRLAIAPLVRPGEGERLPQPISPTSCHSGFLLQQGDPSSSSSQHYPQQVEEDGQLPCDFYCNTIPRPPPDVYPPPLQLRQQLLLQRQYQTHLLQENESGESRERETNPLRGGIDPMSSSTSREFYGETRGINPHHPGNHTVEGLSTRRRLIDEEEERRSRGMSINASQRSSGVFSLEETLRPFYGLRNELSSRDPQPPLPPRYRGHSMTRETGLQSSLPRGREGEEGRESDFPKISSSLDQRGGIDVSSARRTLLPRAGMNTDVFRGSMSLPPPVRTWASSLQNLRGETEWQGESMDCEKTLKPLPHPSHQHTPFAPPLPSCSSSSTARISSSSSSRVSCVVVANDSHQEQQRVNLHRPSPSSGLAPPSLPLLSSPAPHPPLRQHRRKQLVPPHEHHETREGGEEEESIPHPSSHPPREEHNGLTRGARREDEPLLHPTQDTAMRLSEKHPVDVSRSYEEQTAEQQERGGLPPSCERGKDFSPDPHHRYAFLDREDHRHLSHLDRERERDHELTPLQSSPNRRHFLLNEEGRASSVITQKSFDYQQMVQSLEKTEKKEEEVGLLVEAEKTIKKDDEDMGYPSKTHESRGISTLTTTTAPPAPFDILRGVSGLGVGGLSDDFFTTSQPLQRHPYTSNTYHASPHTQQRPALSSAAAAPSSSPPPPSDSLICETGEERGRDGHHQSSRHSSRRASKGGEEEEEREGYFSSFPSFHQEKERMISAAREGQDHRRKAGRGDGGGDCREEEEEEGGGIDSSWKRRTSLEGDFFLTTHGKGRGEESGIEQGDLDACSSSSLLIPSTSRLLQDPSTAARFLPNPRGSRRMGASDRLDSSSSCSRVQPSSLEEKKISSSVLDSSRGTASSRSSSSSGTEERMASLQRRQMGERGGVISRVHTPGDENSPPFLPRPSISSNINKTSSGGNLGGAGIAYNPCLPSPAPSSPPRLVKNHYLTEPSPCNRSPEEEAEGKEQAGGGGGEGQEDGLFSLRPSMSSSFSSVLIERERHKKKLLSPTQTSIPHPNLSGDVGMTPSIPPVVPLVSRPSLVNANSIPSSSSYQRLTRISSSSSSYRPSPVHHTTTNTSKACQSFLFEKSRFPASTTRSFSHKDRQEDPMSCNEKSQGKQTKGISSTVISYQSAYPSHLSTMTSLSRSGEILPEPRPRSRGGEPSYSYPTALQPPSSSSSGRFKKLSSRKTSQEEDDPYQECPRLSFPLSSRDLQTPPSLSPSPSPSLPALSSSMVEARNSSLIERKDDMALNLGERKGGETGISSPTPVVSNALPSKHISSSNGSSRSNSVTLHSHNSSTQSKVSGGGGGANQGNAEGLLLLDVQPSERLPRKMKERKEGDEKNRLMDAPEQGEKREFELSTISVYLEEREKMIDITSKGLPPLPSSSMWRHAMKPSTGSGRGDEKTAERSSLRQKRREQEEEHLEVVEAERGAPERRERREIENEEKITQGKEKMTRKEENCLPTKEKESERNREVPHEVSKERRSLFGKEEEEDEKVEESISSSYPLEPIMEPSRSLSPPRSRRGRVSRCLSPLSRRGSSPSAFPSSIHAFYEEILSTPQLSIDPTKGECLPLLNTSERHPIAMDLSLPPSGERTSKSFTPYDREGEEVKGEQACAMTQSRDLLNTSLEDEGRSQMSRADEKERREAGKQEEEAKERRGSVSSSDGRKGRKIEMLWEPQRSSLPLQRRPLTPPHPHHPFDQDDVNHEALARSRTTLETKKKEKNGEKERRKETHGEISSNKENPLTSTPEPQQQFYVSFPISPPSRHGAMDERDQVAEVLIEEDKSKKKKQVKPEKEENLSDDGGEEIEKKECCSQRGEQGDCPRKCDDLLLISFSLDGDKSEVVVPSVCTPRIPEDKKRATPVRNVEGERVLESDLLKSRSRGGRREGSPELVEEIVLLEQNEEEEDDSPFFSPRITLTTPPKSQPPPAPSHVHHEVSNAPFHEGETCPNVPSLSFVSSENNLDSSISQKTLAPCQQQEQQPTAFPISSDSPPHLIPTSLPPIPHPLISQSSSDVSKHGTLSEYFSQTEHHSACLPIEEPFPSSTSLPVSGGEGREKEEEKNERRSRQVDGEMQHQEGDFNLISQTSSYDRVSRLGAIHYTVDVDEDLMTTLHIRRQEEKDSKRKDEKEGEGEEENGWIVKGRFLDAASVDISTTMPSPTALVGGGGDRSRRRPHRGGREHRRREEDERGEGERESLSLIEREEEEEEEELYSSPVETSLASPSRVEGRKRGDTMYYSIQEEKCFFVDMSKEIDHTRNPSSTNRLPKNDLKMNLTASQASSRRVEEEEKRHREIEAEEGKNGTQHLKLPHSNDKKEEQDKTLLNDRDSLQSKSSSSLHPRMKDLAEPEGSRQSHVHLHEMETSTMLVDSSSHSLPPAASITQTTAAIAAASIVRAVRAAQREETVECLQAGKLAVAAAAATAAASGTAHSEEISLRRPTLGGRERREERGDDKEDIAKEEKQKDEKEERERTVSEREIEDSHTPRYRPRIIPRTRNVGNEEERENGERTSFEQQSRRGSIGSVEETRRSTREGGERRNSTSLHERETDRKTMYMSCEGTSVHGPKPVEEDVSTVTYGVSEKCVDTRGDVVACLLSRDKKLERGETPEYRNTCRSLPCSISHENEYDMVNQSHYSEAKSSEKNVCRSIPCSFEETAMSLRPREVVSDDGEEEERIEVLHSDEDETPMWREGTNSHSRPSNRIDENRRRGEQEGQEGQERFLSLPQPTSTKTLVQRGGGGGGKREKILDEETRHDTMRDGENARMGGGGSKSWEKLNMRNLTVSTDDANELDDGIQGGSGKMMVPTTTGPGGEGGRLFSLDAKKEKKSFLYDEEEEEDNNGIEDIYHEEQRKSHSTRLSRNLPSGTG